MMITGAECGPAPLKYFLLSEGAGQDGSQEDFIKSSIESEDKVKTSKYSV